MEHIEVWKLATDVLLMLSLGLLCVRFLHSPQVAGLAAKSAALEQTLRALIRDAEESGRSLNDQLRNRQQSLERILVEVEGAEQRLKRAQAAANETVVARTPVVTTETTVVPERKSTPPVESEIEPPSFVTERPAQPANQKSASQRLARRIERSTTNIYGEVLNVEKTPTDQQVETSQPRRHASGYAQYSLRGLETDLKPGDGYQEALLNAVDNRSQSVSGIVEIEHDLAPSFPYVSTNSMSAEVAGTTPLDEIYKAAEQMLRAGRDLHYVAARTELPLDEVRVLSQLVEREKPLATAAAPIVTPISLTESTVIPAKKIATGNDPRLGVFATRRPSTTV